MPPRRVLVDTGPLVAILSRADEHHAACVKALHHLPAPLYTCWPVITEATWLLRSHPAAVQRLLRSCSETSRGFLEILPLSSAEAAEVADVVAAYHDMQPQLADAALVYLARREGIDTIFTLDKKMARRDFAVYRSSQKRPFRLLP